MPTLRPISPDAITSLPVQVVERAVLRCTPEQLFESFERDGDWKVWMNLDVQRDTTGPYAEGDTRTVRTGPMVLDERFTLYERGQRMAFYIERANNPLFRAFAEDYTAESTPEGCLFTWRVGLEFTLPGKLVAPLFTRILRRSAAQGMPRLERLAQEGRG